MMKKLLIGLFAVLCAGGASAQQLDVNGQVNNASPRVVAKSGVLSNVLGLDAKTQQTKKADFKLKSNHIWANASQMQQQARLNMPMLSANAKVAKAEKAAADEGLTWFSYITSNDVGAVGFDNLAKGLGADFLAGQDKYNVAIMVPGNYAKAKIDSVDLFILSGCQYDNLTVWVAPVKYVEQDGKNYLSFPKSAAEADVKYVIPAADVEALLKKLPANNVGPLSIKLPTTFSIPAEGAFVGYSFDGKSSDAPVVLAGASTAAAGFFFQYDYEGERNFESLSSIIGMCSSLQVGLDVSDCEANDAAVATDPETTTLVNTDQQYPFYVTNNSAKPITQITYYFTIDGEQQPEKTLDLRYSSTKGKFSSIHNIHNNRTPLHKSIKLKFRYSKNLETYKSKALVVSTTGKSRRSSVGGKAEGDYIVCSVSNFGTYTVDIDTVAPVCKAKNFISGKKIKPKQRSIQVRISDNLSGISSYNAYLNDKWLLAEYDGKSGTLIMAAKDFPKGRSELKIMLSDAKNNTSTHRFIVVR